MEDFFSTIGTYLNDFNEHRNKCLLINNIYDDLIFNQNKLSIKDFDNLKPDDFIVDIDNKLYPSNLLKYMIWRCSTDDIFHIITNIINKHDIIKTDIEQNIDSYVAYAIKNGIPIYAAKLLNILLNINSNSIWLTHLGKVFDIYYNK